MAVKNPITDALLTLHELTAAEQKARIDYEAAQAKRNLYGQGAVRGVATELAEMRMKKQKQQEAIAKAGEGQQASPQAMVPPTIDVSGQTGGRDMAASLKGAAEIAKMVSGGAAIKQGAIGGGFGQTSQNPAISQGINPAAMPALGQPQAPQSGQAVPGGVAPLPAQPISGLERWLGGPLQIIAGAAARSPGAISAGLHELASGTRDTGQYEQLPTVEKMGKDISQTLWAAQEGLTGGAAALNDQFTRIASKYGPEISKQVANAALAEAAEIERQQQLQQNDPKQRLAEQKWRISEILETQGPEALSPGQKIIAAGWDRSTNIENRIMMPATTAQIESDIWKQQDFIQSLNSIDQQFDPEYYTLFKSKGLVANTARAFASHLGLSLGDEDRQKLDKFARLDQSLGGLSLEKAHELIGAYMSPAELPRFDRAFKGLQQSTDPISARASLDQLREISGFTMIRRAHALMMQRSGNANPGDWIKLGDARSLALNDTAARIKELTDQGVDFGEAEKQAFWEIKNVYGLDVSSWPEFKQ